MPGFQPIAEATQGFDSCCPNTVYLYMNITRSHHRYGRDRDFTNLDEAEKLMYCPLWSSIGPEHQEHTVSCAPNSIQNRPMWAFCYFNLEGWFINKVNIQKKKSICMPSTKSESSNLGNFREPFPWWFQMQSHGSSRTVMYRIGHQEIVYHWRYKTQ